MQFEICIINRRWHMNIEQNVKNASRWSILTELLSKMMSPVVNMILARLITPEAFGMVATITMVTSFADIFTDAGFQKFLIQKKENSPDDLDRDTNVAFWTNLSLSLVLWWLIFLFRDRLAAGVGSPELGNAIAIAALSLPLTSFSSIQMARYRRDFDFQTLFFARLVGILVPLFVTVPLAFLLRSFWAVVVGNISVNLANAILLTARSHWKPKRYYCFSRLKHMISFSMWTLIEQLMGWANLNIGIFVVGKYLSDYYLGLYKTSMAMTNQILMILVNAFSPVLFSALSKLTENREEFLDMYYSIIRKTGFIVIPLGIGVFVYRKLFTLILLGSQWAEAAAFVGLWGILRALNIVFGLFSMEVFVSLGKPKFSVLTQALELIVLFPVLMITVRFGYTSVYLARCVVVIWSMAVEMLLLNVAAGISVIKTFKDTAPCFVGACMMGFLGMTLQRINSGVAWNFVSVFICVIFYFAIMYIYPSTRATEKELLRMIKK